MKCQDASDKDSEGAGDDVDVNSLLNDMDVPTEEEDDEEEITPPTVSHAKACEALQTVLMYLEQQPTAPMGTKVIILNGLLLETAKKRVMNQRQTKINDYFSKL